jgi:hypothetical protein
MHARVVAMAWQRPWMPAVGALLAGGALGALSWRGDRFPAEVSIVFNTGWPWLLVAWLIGAWSNHLPRGAANGALALVAGVLAYYAIHVVLGIAAPTVLRLGGAWLLIAAGAGATFGVAGALGRTPGWWSPIVGVSLLAGAMLGEVIYISSEFITTEASPYMIGDEMRLATVAGVILLRDERLSFFILTVLAACALPVVALRFRLQRALGLAASLALAILGYAALWLLVEAFGVIAR